MIPAKSACPPGNIQEEALFGVLFLGLDVDDGVNIMELLHLDILATHPRGKECGHHLSGQNVCKGSKVFLAGNVEHQVACACLVRIAGNGSCTA